MNDKNLKRGGILFLIVGLGAGGLYFKDVYDRHRLEKREGWTTISNSVFVLADGSREEEPTVVIRDNHILFPTNEPPAIPTNGTRYEAHYDFRAPEQAALEEGLMASLVSVGVTAPTNVVRELLLARYAADWSKAPSHFKSRQWEEMQAYRLKTKISRILTNAVDPYIMQTVIEFPMAGVTVPPMTNFSLKLDIQERQ